VKFLLEEETVTAYSMRAWPNLLLGVKSRHWLDANMREEVFDIHEESGGLCLGKAIIAGHLP
jgi:hypothetical protein